LRWSPASAWDWRGRMRRTFLLCSLRQQQPWLGSRRFDDLCDHSSCVHVRRPGVRWGVGQRSQQRGCVVGASKERQAGLPLVPRRCAAPLHRLGNSAPSCRVRTKPPARVPASCTRRAICRPRRRGSSKARARTIFQVGHINAPWSAGIRGQTAQMTVLLAVSLVFTLC
jgi:hypothetical protein